MTSLDDSYSYGDPDKWEIVPIATIIEEWNSVDATVVECPECESSWHVIAVDDNGESREMECAECGIQFEYDFNWILDQKRMDHYYHDVVQSVDKNGWIYPLHYANYADKLYLSDGHHRLAAAMDLGLTTVPVYRIDDARCDYKWQDEFIKERENA